MSLAQAFKNAAASAFKATEGVETLVTFKRRVPGVYNPETGTRDTTETTFNASGRVSDWKVTAVNANTVREGDLKCLFLGADLSTLPSLADQASLNGVEYGIVRVTKDAVGAVVTVQLRAK